ncbi:hypothetical protein [Amycolatopsis jiangsuensis]|uniref:Putative membrane protein n=1 Tax=Amycolatopsis jiangsuensis TaxID=1181879 RepID=A0A840J679_9PSEU|nr:hypothetical protein [Amycolatopsis jiangsuensis]MBB4689105.1 putative membrane protein [Amycolatopsis jiangsuensis]
MVNLMRGVARGVTAGAAGTTALNAASGLDSVVRARPASTVPEQLVERVAKDAIPGRGKVRKNRVAALGPLAGIGNGVGIGGLAGGLRAVGLRLPAGLGGPVLGLAAMVATDGPVALTKVSRPAEWSTDDWLADIVPHLAYGVVTHRTIASLSKDEERPPPAARCRTLIRAGALGAATGLRSSIGMSALSLSARRDDAGVSSRIAGPWAKTGSVVVAAGETVLDKQPTTPDRTEPPGLLPRAGLAATSGGAVAARYGEDPDLPALVGAAAAIGSAMAGIRFRAVARKRCGKDLPGALVEDAVAVVLSWLAVRRGK